MLVEIWSPVFQAHGQVRPMIVFGSGLNVILGEDDGSNSIGKSSTLLAIDYAFGGNTYGYKNGDIIRHVGDHSVFFKYKFGNEEQRFCRKTD